MSAAHHTLLAPAYAQIKNYVIRQIESGAWKVGGAIPTEEMLRHEFKVSRMTVSRALRELSAEGFVVRVQGSGSFVGPRKHQAAVLELRNIADEIMARGHHHRSQLHRLERLRATKELAMRFAVPVESWLFHSLVVHFEDEQAIQLEDRYVNPQLAPDYLSLDFAKQTANAYLMQVAPLPKVQFTIEAALPPTSVAEFLQMEKQEYCLVLRRITYSQNQVASSAVMWHPASRYQFAGGF